MNAIDWQPFSDFVGTLRTSAEPQVLVRNLLDGLVKILGVSRGLVLIREHDAGPLMPVVSHLSSNETTSVEELAEVSRTIAHRAIETDDIVFADGSVTADWFASASAASQALLPRRIVCAPLKAEGRFYGVVYLDGRVGSRLNVESLPFVRVVTGLAAELLGAARTRGQLLDARQRMARLTELNLRDEPFLAGKSEAAAKLDALIDAVASQDVTVLITGETGTGKDMVARELHRRSPRRDGPFVPVNCSALAPDIIEAELFGVEKGAYTGATERRSGRFELADGGTLFLDEIGELSMHLQVKLLRILQERVVTPVGGTAPRMLDVRFVFATNRNLEELVAEGTFRQDMYFRINVFPIPVPPLRERGDDLDRLAGHFLDLFARRFGKKLDGFTAPARRLLASYRWPGNVRELRNVIERAALLERGPSVTPESLHLAPVNVSARSSSSTDDMEVGRLLSQLPTRYDEMVDTMDRLFIEHGITRCNGNVSQFIRESGISRNTLYRRMSKLGMSVGKDEGADEAT